MNETMYYVYSNTYGYLLVKTTDKEVLKQYLPELVTVVVY